MPWWVIVLLSLSVPVFVDDLSSCSFSQKTMFSDFTLNSEELLESLNLSDNFFQVIQATIVDGIILSDKEGTIVYMNRAAQEMLGANPAVIGISRSELIRRQDKYLTVSLEYLYDPFETFNRCLEGDLFTGLTLKVNGEPARNASPARSAASAAGWHSVAGGPMGLKILP